MHITNRSTHLADRYGKRTSAEFFLLHERPILSFYFFSGHSKEARYLS